MAGELAGQVAIVTGGGRGIGRAIALALAAAGARVMVTSRSEGQVEETVALIEQGEGQAIAVPADVTDQDAVESVVATTERQFGPVTLLVNNAGVAVLGPLWLVDPDEWWRTVESNLRGTFLGCRSVLPAMVARRQGRIINIFGGGASSPVPEMTAYGSAKAAILRLTDSLALEVAEYGIRVFALNPGAVGATAMGEQAYQWARNLATQGKYGMSEGNLPPSMPADLAANACVLLASGQADALSGRALGAWQDLPDIIRRAGSVREQDLYGLRLRT